MSSLTLNERTFQARELLLASGDSVLGGAAMELLRNGLASAVVTLCVFAFCTVLWIIVSRGWPIFAIGWVIGIGTTVLALRLQRWWVQA